MVAHARPMSGDEAAIAWPHGARCAVMVSVNFDAELLWLRLDASVAERPKTRSLGEYGARRGLARVLETLERHAVSASWFVPATIATRYADLVRQVAAAGHEIACRGFATERLAQLDAAAQRDVLARSADALERVVGRRPTGFRTFDDMTSATIAVLGELGFRWTSCTRGDDRPFFLETRDGPTAVVDVPFHWECQDVPHFLFNYQPAYPPGQCRISSYARVLEDWTAEFDAYRAAGLCFVLTVDPQAIGRPGRIGLLDRLLAHMRAAGDVWFATGAELGDFWRGADRPNDPGNSEAVRLRVERAGL